jgi:UDP-N-acetylglucosamine 2-epimerase
LKILTVVGARPQFIKAAPVTQALRAAGHQEFLVHTGQHYDPQMSRVFFDEMQIPEPDINLEVGSGSHATQTAQMLSQLEALMETQKPDCVLVYGDTNSTLAGALAAAKLDIRLAHVEAGLRSYNRQMPEEHNRVVADHCSDYLFCPTQTAVENLRREGINAGVSLVGDTMFDAVLMFVEIAEQSSTVLKRLQLQPKEFLLATIHRAYNTDSPEILQGIMNALTELGETVIFPVHPRTREKISQLNPDFFNVLPTGRMRMIEPVGYLDMLILERNARLILTDSGGMQKEAFFFGVPCVTLRPETEWVETVAAGWNVIAGVTAAGIERAVTETSWPDEPPAQVFGDGHAAQKIVALLDQQLGS